MVWVIVLLIVIVLHLGVIWSRLVSINKFLEVMREDNQKSEAWWKLRIMEKEEEDSYDGLN
jgi:uncharacterized protein YneF (UPF0154 family)